jgi:hypothetical protein
MPYYYFEVTKGVEQGRRYVLGDGAVSIGRSSRNTIAFHSSEKNVSAHHAIVYKSPGRIFIQDLQSTNGTFVNEVKVTEQELAPGDIVGFGRMGPRLALVESAEQPDAGVPPGGSEAPKKEETRSRTAEDERGDVQRRSQTMSRMTQSEGQAQHTPLYDDVAPTFTQEMARKIVERRADAGDMHALLKDGKRVERIIGGGQLGETHTNLILSAYHASRTMRKQWYIILGAVVVVALGLIVFFAGRAFQYKQLLNKGLALEQKLDKYDKLIAEAKANPEANRDTLKRLIDEFEKAGQQLESVHGNLREDDIQKFYSDPVEEQIAGFLERFGETNYHIPPQMVERVKYHIGIYSGRMRKITMRYLKRREKYYPMIKSILKENNLPVELSYVAMLESGFNPKALSHAGARGLWQFMPRTARTYGMRVSNRIDERIIPEKATRAAAEYFKDLIGIFGGKSSIMLAMAGYNAGEGRVQGALRKIDDPMRNRDFWYIYRMGYLAEETNEYIPRIIAFAIISENLNTYGFAGAEVIPSESEELEAEDDFVEFDLNASYEE